MIIDSKTKERLKVKFEKELIAPVDVKVFTRNIVLRNEDPQYTRFAKELVQEFAEVSSKIKAEFYSLEDTLATKLNLSLSPTVLVGRDNGFNIEYWGAPAGQESATFIETIIMVSTKTTGLSKNLQEKLKEIENNVLLETFITLNCPYCPQAVLLANKMAIESNGKVISRCIEAQENIERASRFGVSSVPQQVINEDINSVMVGVQPEEKLVEYLLKYGINKI